MFLMNTYFLITERKNNPQIEKKVFHGNLPMCSESIAIEAGSMAGPVSQESATFRADIHFQVIMQ